MTDADVYGVLGEVFDDVFEDRALRLAPEMRLEDIAGWDSFKCVLLLSAVEARFGIKAKSQEIDDITTVGDIVRMIMARRR